MGRTIPSFRIATVWEGEKWKLNRKYLRNKNEKKLFTHMFSISHLYNSACSNAVIPIRIFPILMSIIFHHYKKILKSSATIEFDNNSSSAGADYDINAYNNNSTTILKQELDKWHSFSSILRKQNRELFEQMLQSSYKYSRAIEAKGQENSTESLFMTLIFEQYKKIVI